MLPYSAPSGLKVVQLLLRCHKLEKNLASAAGMSVDEFHFLSQLYVHAPCCVKTLCEQTGIHPPRASRLLNTLEQKKYVVRALGIDDRRKELLTLTELGLGVAREILRSCASSEYFLSELTAVAPENGTAPH